jgi:hypothetical protein
MGFGTYLLKGVRVKANCQTFRELFGKASTDGLELVFAVSGTMGIPACSLFLDAGKCGDTFFGVVFLVMGVPLDSFSALYGQQVAR